ncbi:MAG: hypothetical protein AB9873_13525 [Syntrophobacteraceae bacterium]
MKIFESTHFTSFGISRTTVYRLIKREALKAVKSHRKELDRFARKSAKKGKRREQ